jgi:hypothetical protein
MKIKMQLLMQLKEVNIKENANKYQVTSWRSVP